MRGGRDSVTSAPLLSALSRVFVQPVLEFYAKRGGGKRDPSGAVTAVQSISSDLKLQPHLHAVFLDGIYREEAEDLAFHPLAHLSTTEVAEVLERTSRRMKKWLRRRALLQDGDDSEGADDNGGPLRACRVGRVGHHAAGGKLDREGRNVRNISHVACRRDDGLGASNSGPYSFAVRAIVDSASADGQLPGAHRFPRFHALADTQVVRRGPHFGRQSRPRRSSFD